MLLNVSNNKITKEILNDIYVTNLSVRDGKTDRFNAIDSVINTLISIVESVKSLPSFYEDKKQVREFVALKLFEELDYNAKDKESALYLKFSQKVEAFFFCYDLFLDIEENDFVNAILYKRIVEFKEKAKIRQDYSYLPEVIVSLTSFPGRIDKIYKSLNSIFTQSFKPDRIILWLAQSQFPGKEEDIPDTLQEYVKLGLDIRWCKEDLRPHKKYFYVMQQYPNALIVTVDDDLVYDEQMIEALITSYLHFPNAVSATRTHLITKDVSGNIAPYAQWEKQFSGILGIPSMQLFSTSGAGTLYPPHSMGDLIFNIEDIKKLCLNADDLWLKIMQVKRGTPVVLARNNEKLKYVPETQADSLKQTNINLNENDIQLKNILEKYDVDNELIDIIFKDNYTSETNIVGIDISTQNDFGLLDSAGRYLRIAEKNRVEYTKINEKYVDLYAKFKTANEARKNLNERINTIKENNNSLREKNDSLREKNINLNNDFKKLSEEHKRLNKEHQNLDTVHKKTIKEKEKLEKGNETLNIKLENKNREIEELRNSLSYKIGRIITYIPRLIREFLGSHR